MLHLNFCKNILNNLIKNVIEVIKLYHVLGCIQEILVNDFQKL